MTASFAAAPEAISAGAMAPWRLCSLQQPAADYGAAGLKGLNLQLKLQVFHKLHSACLRKLAGQALKPAGANQPDKRAVHGHQSFSCHSI